jgi:hypothetical protein
MNNYLKKVFWVLVCTFIGCVPLQFNEFTINGQHDYTAKLPFGNNALSCYIKYALSQYYKQKNQVIFNTLLTNQSPKVLFLPVTAFSVVSSTQDQLFLEGAMGFFNTQGVFIKIKKLNAQDTMMIQPGQTVQTNFVFNSKRIVSYESYKKAFLRDSFYWICNQKRTDILLKGTYILKDTIPW